MQQLEEIVEEQEEAPPPPPVSRPAAPARTAARPAPKVPAVPQNKRPMVAPAAETIFSGIESVEVYDRTVYCGPGRYLARIDRVTQGINRKKAFYVAIEMTIVHVFSDGAGQGHRVGDAVTRYIGASDYFLKDIKAFISKALDVDPSQIDEDDCIMVVGEEQPLAGFVVEWEGVQKPAKKQEPGQPMKFFTNIFFKGRWEPEDVANTLDPETFAHFFGEAEAA
ncbi:MAG: hypothetical protein LC123_02475 [Burkholderiales bacterium]|nr:hypothetical protein [Burkholderiales bacterium]